MRLKAFAFAAVAAFASSAALAEYPDRVVQMIVPFPAGGAVDNVGRAFAQVFDSKIGQRVAVLNREGGSTTIGMNALLSAPNDGYTVLYGPVTALTVHLHWMKGLQFNQKSFVPVCQAFENVFMLATREKSPFQTLNDVVHEARSKPGVLSYAHSGVAGAPHLTAAEFFQKANVSLTDIPFRGENAMLQPMREGSVDVAAVTVNFVDVQKLKPLVVFSDQRYPTYPDVPTAKELGYRVTPAGYGGLFMRSDTPAPIVRKVETACKATMADPGFREVARRNYQLTEYLDSAQLSARMRSDSETNAALLKTIKLEK